jgi:short subunit dehydrogenase-like uncharacterized protein
MSGRIVVFGATGYTGRLAVAALAARGARPLLAGRDRERLERLAAEHGGLDCAVASADDPGALGGLLGPGDVLLTTVGPFTRFGHGPLDAAIGAGAHYVDATGEAAFIRHVFTEAGPRAERAGVALLTAFGFDFVPGNLAGALAARQAGQAATRLDIGYFTAGTRASSGTMATAGVLLDQPSHLRRAGELRLLPFARRTRTFHDGDRRRRAALFGGTEPLALPRVAPGLRDVAVWLGALGRYTRAAQAASFLLPVVGRLPPVRARIRARADRLMATTGKGPDEAARARARTVVIAVAAGPGGRRPLATVRLTGRDPYSFTGAMLADAARRLAGGRVAGVGTLGPVEAYGLDELEAACATAGTVRAPA